MPKDRVGVQDQFNSGGTLNEFEFAQNQRALVEHEHQTPQGQTSGGEEAMASLPSPLDEAERIRQVTAAAHEIVERRRAKLAGHSSKDKAAKKTSATKKAAVKKSGAKKAAVKKAAVKKAGVKKFAAKKSSARKSPATKSAAKKAVAKKSAVKKSAKKSASKKSAGKKSKR